MIERRKREREGEAGNGVKGKKIVGREGKNLLLSISLSTLFPFPSLYQPLKYQSLLNVSKKRTGNQGWKFTHWGRWEEITLKSFFLSPSWRREKGYELEKVTSMKVKNCV